MTETMAAIRREVTVPLAPERAFDLFTRRMTEWWPSAHHIGSAPIAEIVVEPFEGGRWFTRHEDDSETSTGYVETWDPPERLVLTWQITAEWEYDPRLITRVELTFTAVEDGTRVALEHRDLQSYGPAADKMRETFEQPGAWEGTLEAYSAVARQEWGA